MAKRMDVNRATLRKWLTGERRIPSDMYRTLHINLYKEAGVALSDLEGAEVSYKTFKGIWKYGEKRKLALRADVSPQFLSSILNRKFGAGKVTALRLEKAAKALGKDISAKDFMFAATTDSPYFCPKPSSTRR